MSAKDHYHDVVVRALVKAGWVITSEQFRLIIPDRQLYVDIRAAKDTESLDILIEVKGFENARSPVEYLAGAIGKYILYRTVLDFAGIDAPLYMAVSRKAAYNGILNEQIGKEVVRRAQVHLLVFDPESEEILAWIN